MIEEEAPKTRPARLQYHLLESWGVDELTTYIGELRAEIARAELDISRKQSHRSVADLLFKRID